jgi:hypothetical protein
LTSSAYFFLQEEEVDLRLADLHGHAVLAWVHRERVYLLVYSGEMEREWYFAEACRSLVLIPNHEVALIVEDEQIRELVEEDVEVLEL